MAADIILEEFTTVEQDAPRNVRCLQLKSTTADELFVTTLQVARLGNTSLMDEEPRYDEAAFLATDVEVIDQLIEILHRLKTHRIGKP